jgi:DNA-binding HxlR family transcriptional regulator
VTYSRCVINVEHLLEAHSDQEMCRASQRVIEFVGQRWVSVVLIAGYVGARRFSEYRRFAVGISDRLLTLRLRQLEERGLLERTVVPTMPVQITYEPTDSGRALVEALGPLFSWGVDQPA